MTEYTATAENGSNPSIQDTLRAFRLGKYKTDDLTEYTKWIKSINLADLQSHAVEIGVRPYDDRRRTEALLVREFQSFASNLKRSEISRKTTLDDKRRRAEQIQKARELMSWVDAR